MSFSQKTTVFNTRPAPEEGNPADYCAIIDAFDLHFPLLEFIDWEITEKNNVEVLSKSLDYYRYFDATVQAEFVYICVEDTINRIIPEEVDYLRKYDKMKEYLENEYDMPDRAIALLIGFLEQNDGKLSKRVREKEFSILHENEIAGIEIKFMEIMRRSAAI